MHLDNDLAFLVLFCDCCTHVYAVFVIVRNCVAAGPPFIYSSKFLIVALLLVLATLWAIVGGVLSVHVYS